MNKQTKEFLIIIGITTIVAVVVSIVMAFFMSGIPVLQIIATVIIIAALIYYTWFWFRDYEDDDFRG